MLRNFSRHIYSYQTKLNTSNICIVRISVNEYMSPIEQDDKGIDRVRLSVSDYFHHAIQ